MQLILWLILNLAMCYDGKLKPITGPKKVGKLILSPIGGGTWSWGNQFLWQYNTQNDNNLQNVFDYATKDQKITWFDTADSYGTGKYTGQSEKLLGQFLNANKKTQNTSRNIHFCTKLAPFPWRLIKNSVYKTFLTSQNNLQKNSIDMIQFHWPPILPYQETQFINAFEEIFNQQLAIQMGVSNYGPKGLQKISNRFQQIGQTVYTNQVQFSLLSRMPLDNGLTDVCEELSIQPIAYSPLGLGLLSDKYTLQSLPSGPRGILFKEYLPVIEDLLNNLRDISKFRRKTVSQVAINWVLQKGFLALVGIRDVAQTQETLGAVGWSLSSSEIDVLDQATKKLRKSLIQNPNQCV